MLQPHYIKNLSENVITLALSVFLKTYIYFFSFSLFGNITHSLRVTGNGSSNGMSVTEAHTPGDKQVQLSQDFSWKCATSGKWVWVDDGMRRKRWLKSLKGDRIFSKSRGRISAGLTKKKLSRLTSLLQNSDLELSFGWHNDTHYHTQESGIPTDLSRSWPITL